MKKKNKVNLLEKPISMFLIIGLNLESESFLISEKFYYKRLRTFLCRKVKLCGLRIF